MQKLHLFSALTYRLPNTVYCQDNNGVGVNSTGGGVLHDIQSRTTNGLVPSCRAEFTLEARRHVCLLAVSLLISVPRGLRGRPYKCPLIAFFIPFPGSLRSYKYITW